MCKSSSNQKKKKEAIVEKNTDLHDQGLHHW